MMKFLISLVIGTGLAVGAWNLWKYWGSFSGEKTPAQQQAEAVAAIDPSTLPGLPEKLAGPLAIAERRGGPGLRDWLKHYRKELEDPRLAWLELDCCLLLAKTSPAEAKELYASVKQRLAPNSPVYPRLKQLERMFE